MAINKQEMLIEDLRNSIEFYKKKCMKTEDSIEKNEFKDKIMLLQERLNKELKTAGYIPEYCPLYSPNKKIIK
jgi:hypothetical protein